MMMMKRAAATLACAATLLPALPSHAASYVMDPMHTFVTFEVVHFGTSTNRGRFDKKEGSFEFDAASKTGKVSVTLDTTSINTGTEMFNGHLKKDFFNVEKYPSAKFEGNKVTFVGGKPSEVAGQLTLLGKTQPVTLKASNFNCYQNPMIKREVCGGDFMTTIKRSQWGMDWALDKGVPDDVRLVIQVEGARQD